MRFVFSLVISLMILGLLVGEITAQKNDDAAKSKRILQIEKEILITRDSRPVAKLVRYDAPEKARKRFDAVAHGKWQRTMSGSSSRIYSVTSLGLGP